MAGEAAPAAARFATRVPFQEVRCHRCGGLLFKIEAGALKPGKTLEIKCRDCKVFNYATGEDEA